MQSVQQPSFCNWFKEAYLKFEATRLVDVAVQQGKRLRSHQQFVLVDNFKDQHICGEVFQIIPSQEEHGELCSFEHGQLIFNLQAAIEQGVT